MAHRAYSRSAISVDKSQIPPLSGNFQKLNKYGIYQTRYWAVNNAYLAYWHSKKDHDAAKNKPQAAFDLAASEEVCVCRALVLPNIAFACTPRRLHRLSYSRAVVISSSTHDAAHGNVD